MLIRSIKEDSIKFQLLSFILSSDRLLFATHQSLDRQDISDLCKSLSHRSKPVNSIRFYIEHKIDPTEMPNYIFKF